MSDEIVAVPLPTYNNFVNLLGHEPFGRLTVLAYAGMTGPGVRKHTSWYCECSCDKKIIIMQGRSLSSGNTQSCGCLNFKRNGLSSTKLFHVWYQMMARCHNPDCKSFCYYGERNIVVTIEWHDFEMFREWAITNGYQGGLEIDRINTNGNYEPTNCRWVTRQVNQRNKRGWVNTKSTSKYVGVCFEKFTNRWKASGKLNGKVVNLGRFDSEDDAAKARDAFYELHFPGLFHRNFPLTEQPPDSPESPLPNVPPALS